MTNCASKSSMSKRPVTSCHRSNGYLSIKYWNYESRFNPQLFIVRNLCFWRTRIITVKSTIMACWAQSRFLDSSVWCGRGFQKHPCEKIKRNTSGFKSCSDDKAKNNQTAPQWSRRTGRRQKRFPPDHTLTTRERMWVQRPRQKESRKKLIGESCCPLSFSGLNRTTHAAGPQKRTGPQLKTQWSLPWSL